jgi:F420H(2)-dependent quinone reductase
MVQTQVPKGPAKLLSAFHKGVYKISGGKIGGSFSGGSIVLLTTTGRKSGKARTTPLMTMKDEGDYIVIASFSGHDAHPAWYLNLEANPAATVTLGRDEHKVVAVMTEGEDRKKLYDGMTEIYSDYAEYQKATDRVIPVVRLTPG